MSVCNGLFVSFHRFCLSVVCLSVCLSVYLSVCLSVCLPVRQAAFFALATIEQEKVKKTTSSMLSLEWAPPPPTCYTVEAKPLPSTQRRQTNWLREQPSLAGWQGMGMEAIQTTTANSGGLISILFQWAHSSFCRTVFPLISVVSRNTYT
jgi:hypothetical protein